MFGDLSRVNTNSQAQQALSAFNRTNADLGMRQMRLATGSKLNRAEDDTAGFTIAKKLEAKVRGQAQALDNIADAKGLLTVAEGSLGSVMDILQNMKAKSIQAANDTMGADERTAIANELAALASEIDSIIENTDFNGQKLLDGTGGSNGDGTFTFQVGSASGDTFTTVALDISALQGLAFDVSDNAAASAEIDNIDGYIAALSAMISGVGDDQKALTFKSENLETAMNNYDAARSRIADADFAKEQMQIVKLQILQQTGVASLAQANQAPQAVLSLLR
ncbi:MAG: flagellin [Rubricoccaceae bacterium]